MKAFCEVLEQLYKKVLLGASLENDSHDYIFYLNPAFPDQDFSTMTPLKWSNTQGVQGTHQPCSVNLAPISVALACLKRPSWMSSSREITLLQLTVIKMMITRILSMETEFHTKEKYRVIIKILLKSSEVDSKLTCMFQNSDKLLSHMAAECLALLLYFQLREKITLSNSWITFCQKNLSEYSESNKVVYCLQTLTVVIKEIFKHPCSQKTEILKQFLMPFNTTFEVFYNSLFSQRFENCQETSKIINSLVCFLELLELLIASRIYLKSHFTCQRIFFLEPSYVLDVLTWPTPAFVKRKLIVFVKKCLLCKVGEDLFRGCVPVLLPLDHLLDVDMLAVANTVLQAVSLGWLRTLSVHGKPSSFGGDDFKPGCERNSGPDHVILRAATLVLIKSLEIKFQNCTSANEIQVGLQRYMSELLNFLKPHLQPSLQSHSPCEWLSRVFIEQDDDMLEAAKALLGIYLKLTRECCEATESSAQEKEIRNRHTHENGYNPHCVFLFFLKNIGFDSTVLLDFLISSETCFLEYFVRYLKLLQKDWHDFFTICKCFDAAELKDGISLRGCIPSPVQDRSTNQTEPHYRSALGSHTDAYARISWASDASSEPLKRQHDFQAMMSKETHSRLQAASLSSSPASQSLVNYDSSDDSEVELTDPCLASSKQTSLHQEAIKKIQDTSGTSRSEKELTLGPQPRPVVPKEPNSSFSVDCQVALNSTVSQVGISYRTVKCFEELQGAIDRLQKKNLFPYNPTALLKLLKPIETLCKSMSPL
ncbi:protein Lines homolog 1 isoform X1 [Elephas maximus indicus]|uniref:protein Lines homolog 1 isoform X1 n=2 Tax=Elephas maximus indicus TaxID=99487 RepID=UPI00211637E6|nr:protein Lines homolog 1 isoform X1 [Elephas maximus indicus]XP_049761445.1 protein Lines homolog 1 isoform X1 [Elephas maximus indicus]XP_049761446.1 protein Lines homolog 1 isoform X1 [Elephas maximus indicus]XP_049761447.1 protein Lines homolog 1 isoform X1 [Elephas maximus indicus]